VSLGILFVFLRQFGLMGVAAAFTATQFVHVFTYFVVVRRRAAFAWNSQVIRIMLVCGCFMGVGLVIHYCLDGPGRLVAGVAVVLIASLFALRRLLAMVTLPSRIRTILKKVPFASRVAGRTRMSGEDVNG